MIISSPKAVAFYKLKYALVFSLDEDKRQMTVAGAEMKGIKTIRRQHDRIQYHTTLHTYVSS